MSVELSVVTKTYDFVLWLLPHLADFPRQHRFTLGDRIEEVFAMDVLPPIVEDMFGKVLRERERHREEIGRREGEEIGRREGEEIGRREGEEIGRKEGEEIGALRDARAILIRLYARRLGAPPAEVIARLEAMTAIEELHALIDRYDEQIESWEQLLPPR